MELRKNTDIIKILFQMKDIEKAIMGISHHIKSIKVPKHSFEIHNRCFNTYQEGSFYFFQCCGFLKSQYLSNNISPTSRKFLIEGLYIPSCKRFKELYDNLSHLEVETIYESSLKLLMERVQFINNSLLNLQNGLTDMS